MLITIVKYFNTLKYLKLSQIIFRVIFIYLKKSPKISFTPKLRKVSGDLIEPINKIKSLVGPYTFIFLNEKGNIKNLGWDNPKRAKLWRYNLHYFDDLSAEANKERTDWHKNLMTEWVVKNEPGNGSGWEPYPTSLRIVNWVKWQLSKQSMSTEILNSLATQARWLYRSIEWHILGNHLFSNAKALVFSGLFFEGKEPDLWLSKGLHIIKKELSEQILDDGGHFERSPMYHALFLEALLDLINLSYTYSNHISSNQVLLWKQKAQKMMGFLEEMCHPDGEISFFNDAAIGIAASKEKLLKYCDRVGVLNVRKIENTKNLNFFHLTDSGYIRLQSSSAYAILDVAPIGPDYLTGHAHADTLAFELSILSTRVIVNGGTSLYENGPVRLKERGTESHSTVEINGKNSSDVWSSFRVGKRAYPMNLSVNKKNDEIYICCFHNGYQRLQGKPLHQRIWKFKKNSLKIEDKIFNDFDNAIARFYLHPDIHVIKVKKNLYLLKTGLKSLTFSVSIGEARIQNGFYSPEFGKRLKTKCLAVNFKSTDNIVVEINWNKNEL